MKKIILSIVLLILISCSNLNKFPTNRYYSFMYYFDRNFNDDTIYFNLKNPLMCPLNIKLTKDSLNPNIENLFKNITLRQLQDTIIRIYYPNFNQTKKSNYIVNQGDFNQKIIKNKIAFPFPQYKNYKLIQGYNGKYSHTGIYHQYALDFNLKIGDTVCSADEGYVVELIKDYKGFGTSKQWRDNDRSNYITLFHPQSGLFTQYVHLQYDGVLIKLGDFVKKGQKIGISGMTGFTTTPHLHFNVKIPSKDYGLVSTEIEFENGVKGKDLKINGTTN